MRQGVTQLLVLLGVCTGALGRAVAARRPAGFVVPSVPSVRLPTSRQPFSAAPCRPTAPADILGTFGAVAYPGHRARCRTDVMRRRIAPTLIQDIGGAVAIAAATSVWLKIWTTLASAGCVDSKISRKIIHCGSGPLFLLCWPFFSASPSARFIAAAVPVIQVVALLFSGLSTGGGGAKQATGISPAGGATAAGEEKAARPKGLVAAISRSGNPAEVLRGPFIYVLVLLLSTLVYWRENVVGIIAISQMAAGDGMADIVGRKFGIQKWPFSKDKSYIGSLAFVVAGFIVSLGLISWFHFWNLIPFTVASSWAPVLAISVICAMVELMPIGDDNITVPAAASLFAVLFFT